MENIELIRTEEVMIEFDKKSYVLLFDIIIQIKIRPSLREAQITGEIAQKVYIARDSDYL